MLGNIAEKKDLILEELKSVARLDVYLKHDIFYKNFFEDFKDFKEYYYKCTDLTALLSYAFYHCGFKDSEFDDETFALKTFDTIFTWKQFKALFYSDFLNIIDNEVKKYENQLIK